MKEIKAVIGSRPGVFFLRPEHAWGEDGKIFQLYVHGEPQQEYLISPARNEDCILLWWYEEEGRWEIATKNRNGLREYLPHVTIAEVPGRLTITLELP